MTKYFDFNDPELRADRFEYYRRFRETDPVHKTPHGYWMLFRYDDAETLLKHSGSSSNFPANENWAKARGGPTSPVIKASGKWMLMQDHEAHKRLRRVIGKLFTPRMIDKMRARVPDIVETLMSGIDDSREVDLMSTLAFPVPITVVSELIGIPEADREVFRTWSEPVGHVIDRTISPQRLIAMNKAEPRIRAYIVERMNEARHAEPVETMISMMTHAAEDFTEDETAANVGLLYNAGHETTANLIGNGMLALLRQPAAMRRLREEPSLMGTAIEELSRFDPSARFACRILTEDLTLGEKTIPAGEAVFVAFDAVGRDPERYPDPDQLDLGRTGVKSLAFSAGPHHCMGKMLAMVEAGTLFRMLLDRYRKIELVDDNPPYQEHFNLNMLAKLPLRLTR
ncbi:cytochrome P450 [Labedaea rhizosphaerae]|uniref:Cytochrome P450 n=1 Tax=Labedaea rhizosphaerae TaxID=598644 RepID=A0A4R6S0C3_LABRH|nr:cytochrome P450 [Labedaea rhizosphaerae]TDP92890.1 cytochrome P450 [Labedaea rhizosphaerae]